MGGVQRQVAVAVPRPRWMGRDRFLREIIPHQADPGLADDLKSLGEETTDDLPWFGPRSRLPVGLHPPEERSPDAGTAPSVDG